MLSKLRTAIGFRGRLVAGVTVMPPRFITLPTSAAVPAPFAMARRASRSEITPTRLPASFTTGMWRNPNSMKTATASAMGRSGWSVRTPAVMISATVAEPENVPRA